FSFDKKIIEPDETEDTYVQHDITSYLQVSEGVRKKFTLPGTLETIIVANKIYHPWTEGINCLMKADSFLPQNDDALADINYKIGDMFTWQGLPEQAATHYKKSVDLKPADANTRIKLIETYSGIYYLKDALEQLDSLYQRKEINFSMQLLMAEYCIHSGRFSDATNLLGAAKQIHPYKIPRITNLNGRLQLLSNHPKEALPFYKEYLSANPDDSLTMYTIARLYAQMGNKEEAWKWLRLSLNKGFDFYWVLQYDTTWNNFRKLSKWKDITGRIPVPEITEY
ncbi:MAG TPA: tetratricopeptide repeat protein, partial [Chitinophagaceae bacterium]|nr:tetratricopeptide repeat protein [Chitinophagaceae bacterium]